MIRILEIDLSVCEVRRVSKRVIRHITANRAQALNVASSSSNNIHWSFGVVHAVGISNAVVDRHKSLRIVYVPKYCKIDAVFVQEWLEGRLAWSTAATA